MILADSQLRWRAGGGSAVCLRHSSRCSISGLGCTGDAADMPAERPQCVGLPVGSCLDQQLTDGAGGQTWPLKLNLSRCQ
jgi:hypothetical protein